MYYRHFYPTAGLIAMCWTASASAYSKHGHQQLVNQGWQAMRALSADDFSDQLDAQFSIDMGLDGRLTTAPSFCKLSASDPRNLCKEVVTDSMWTSFRDEVKLARQHLFNRVSDMPAISSKDLTCSAFNPGTAGPTQTLGNYPDAVTPDHVNHPEFPQEFWGLFGAGGCARYEGYQPPGIFAKLKTVDDGLGHQGLVLGWHAEHRDDDNSDTTVLLHPVQAILSAAAAAGAQAIGVYFAQWVCLVDWAFGSGGDCWSHALDILNDADPTEALAGGLPGIKVDSWSEDGRGFWHFLNVQSGLSNSYDDRQGLFYEEAGPAGEPAVIDQAIILAGDTLYLKLDASESEGTRRYELTSAEVSSGASKDRGNADWQSERIGHIQFSPIDNFAFYGDSGRPNDGLGADQDNGVERWGWPLHAIGDVTVPMHVVGTTGWGHRPYEEFVDENIRVLFIDGTTVATARQQVDQVERIAAHAFRWRKRITADIRPFITELAEETLALTPATPTGKGTLWCDACSNGHATDSLGLVGVAYLDADDRAAFDNPEGYYEAANHVAAARQHLERAAGAAAAYLIKRAAQGSTCAPTGASCTANAGCCGESSSCSSGRCVRNVAPACRPKGAACSAASTPCCNQRICTGVCEDPPQ